ncbi:MAG: glucoamylase family protein [Chitinophagaceae bacterium]
MMEHKKNRNSPVTDPQGTDKEMLKKLLTETFDYFLNEVNPVTGLVADKTEPGFPSSIAVTGMAITAYIIGVEKKLLSRKNAIERVLKILRFFYDSQQGKQANATGYKGFYYHFLKMNNGEREWKCELSTIDTSLFIAGALCAASYFKKKNREETEIRDLADKLYRRIDWQWALNNGDTICHGWKPRSGFLSYRWDDNYSEAMIMYVLALGSPTFPIKPEAYKTWTDTFKVSKVYDTSYLYAGPLFIHQFSHMWIDFRGIHDAFNKTAGFDYFENSRRATYIHRLYAIENKLQFKNYGEYCWGLTASDGPGEKKLRIDGRQRVFYNYIARGAPYGPDDGTVSPWAVVASLPFAPEIVLGTIRHAIEKLNLKPHKLYGFDASFNPTFPEKGTNTNGWVSPWRFGLNQGPIVIMIENYNTELIWTIMKKCTYVVKGLQMAGFSEGWLDKI